MSTALGLLAALLFVPGLAFAVPTLSFDNPTLDGGTMTYDGAGGPVLARNVIFQEVIGVDTPVNAGVSLFCFPSPCLLSFDTGNNLTENTPTAGVYTFAGGGSISMTGGLNTIEGGGGTQIVPGGTDLVVSGSFNDPSLVLAGAVTGNLLFIGTGIDLKDTVFAAFYGLTNPFGFVDSEVSLGQAVIDPLTAAFTAVVTDADFQNTAAIPMPMTAILLGVGMVGMVTMRRR